MQSLFGCFYILIKFCHIGILLLIETVVEVIMWQQYAEILVNLMACQQQ